MFPFLWGCQTRNVVSLAPKGAVYTSLAETPSFNSYTHCNILVLCGRKETCYNIPKVHTSEVLPPNQTKISYQTEFQINAILSRSLQFTKLQKFKFDKVGGEVDQEVLDAAHKVIPNIVIGKLGPLSRGEPRPIFNW